MTAPSSFLSRRLLCDHVRVCACVWKRPCVSGSIGSDQRCVWFPDKRHLQSGTYGITKVQWLRPGVRGAWVDVGRRWRGDNTLPAAQACWRWESVTSDLTPSPVKRSQMFSPVLSSSHFFFWVFFCVLEADSVLRASALLLSCLLYVLSLPNALCPPMPRCIKLEQRTLFFFS